MGTPSWFESAWYKRRNGGRISADLPWKNFFAAAFLQKSFCDFSLKELWLLSFFEEALMLVFILNTVSRFPVQIPHPCGSEPSVSSTSPWAFQHRSLISHWESFGFLIQTCTGHCDGLQVLDWILWVSSTQTDILHSSTSNSGKHWLIEGSRLTTAKEH